MKSKNATWDNIWGLFGSAILKPLQQVKHRQNNLRTFDQFADLGNRASAVSGLAANEVMRFIE